MKLIVHVGNLKLRQFAAADSRDLYAIRNHISVRRYMSNQSLISYKSHRAWVKENLLFHPKITLLLIRTPLQPRAIGLTQLRHVGDSAEIGVIFREPKRHSTITAVATIASLILAFEYFHSRSVFSYVIPEHSAAIAFNKAFGAWEEISDKTGMIKLRLNQEAFLANGRSRPLLERVRAKYWLEERL